MMRAAFVREFGDPEKVQIEAVPKPQAGERQVLIRVEVAGVNPIDCYIRQGTYPTLPPLPYIVGREGAGVVEDTGAGATKYKPGDRVWFVAMSNCASAELAAINEEHVFKLPDRLNFKQGATLAIAYLTAYRALFGKAAASAGETLFVHGASGGVGLAACELAKVHGLRVVGTASSQEGIKLATQQGCEVVYNHRQPGYVDEIRQRYSDGFPIILEMLANVNLRVDLELLLALHGRVVVVGSRGELAIDPRACMAREVTISGVALANCSGAEIAKMAERLNSLIEAGHITPYVGTSLPLEQLATAHMRIMEPGARGKLVVTITPQEDDNIPRQAPTGPGADQLME